MTRFRHVCWLAGLGGLASTVIAADESAVIFPARAAEVHAPVAAMSPALLLVGAALAGIAGWLFWRGRRATARTADGRTLAIEETRSLGNRQYLVVAAYEGKKYLLGVCPGRIDTLAALHNEAPRP